MWPVTPQDDKEIFVDYALTDDNYGTYPRQKRVKNSNNNSNNPTHYPQRNFKDIRSIFDQDVTTHTKMKGNSFIQVVNHRSQIPLFHVLQPFYINTTSLVETDILPFRRYYVQQFYIKLDSG